MTSPLVIHISVIVLPYSIYNPYSELTKIDVVGGNMFTAIIAHTMGAIAVEKYLKSALEYVVICEVENSGSRSFWASCFSYIGRAITS
jgi:hypothetical protein